MDDTLKQTIAEISDIQANIWKLNNELKKARRRYKDKVRAVKSSFQDKCGKKIKDVPKEVKDQCRLLFREKSTSKSDEAVQYLFEKIYDLPTKSARKLNEKREELLNALTDDDEQMWMRIYEQRERASFKYRNDK
jgi:hypothetical protein